MTRINATNSLGWGIQKLSSEGWQWTTNYRFSCKYVADEWLEMMREGDTNYRVYEAVTEREQA